jgi:hypothetical protein
MADLYRCPIKRKTETSSHTALNVAMNAEFD